MRPYEYECETSNEGNRWYSFFRYIDWDGLKAEVEQENRARIALVGPGNAGKSTLFNLLKGWEVSPTALKVGETRKMAMEDLGLFSLIDLPHQPWEPPLSITDDTASYYGPGMMMDTIMFKIMEADLVIYVVDGQAGLRPSDYQWLSRIRAAARPTLVVLNKVDALDGCLTEVEKELNQRLACQVVSISAREGLNIREKLVPSILDACPSLAVPLGREMLTFRQEAARRVIRQAVMLNALFGAEPIPLLDIPLQLATQMRLVLRLAAIYGHATGGRHRKEVLVTLAGGIGLRYLAQQVAKLAPFLGWAASGLLGAVGTWLIGRTAQEYFAQGKTLPVTRSLRLPDLRFWNCFRRRKKEKE